MSKFKVGDRVRIASLPGYIPNEDQGLIVGNTGTVIKLYGTCYGVQTDNATDNLGGDGGGWGFFDDNLRALNQKPSFLRRLFGLKEAA